MTGTLTLSGAPVVQTMVATKAYVDSAVAGAGGSGGVMNLSNTASAGTYPSHADPPMLVGEYGKMVMPMTL